jgi:hypothetical protein
MARLYAVSHLIQAKQAISELLSILQPHATATYALVPDNVAALGLIKDSRVNSRTKHLAVHYLDVHERL